MSHTSGTPPFPRNILIIVGTVIVLSILLAAFGRMSGYSISKPAAAIVISRSLLFRDRADGGVAIYDARDQSAPISIAAPGTNGFLRATMRGLARQRLREDVGSDIPFVLTEWADGRLTLEDPTTHRVVEMEAFGITNEEVFARLLTDRPIRAPTQAGAGS